MENAYVINLAVRPDRWEQMKRKWSKYFNLIRVDAIPTDPNDTRTKVVKSTEALGLTHMKLLKDAQSQGLKTILVLEDDAIPEDDWFDKWKEIKSFLDSNLNDWDVFNGGTHLLRDYYGIKKLNKSVLVDGRFACASHFMYLNLESIDKFLTWHNNPVDIDQFYCNNFKLYCSYPILAKQADGQSDIVDEVRKWDETYIFNELYFKKNLGDLYLEYKPIRSRF